MFQCSTCDSPSGNQAVSRRGPNATVVWAFCVRSGLGATVSDRLESLATWRNGDASSRDITEVCIQEGALHEDIHMNARPNRRAELRAAAIAVAFFILCAVAAFHS